MADQNKIEEDIQQATPQEALEIALGGIRVKRDALLKQSDWTVLPDVSLAENKKEQWAAYRQALRDLPNNYDPAIRTVFPKAPV